MIAWYFLLGALALLVTVMLLGFVGCSAFSAAPDPGDGGNGGGTGPGGGTPPPPDYGPYGNKIMGTNDLVAYWRLGDPAASPVLKASDPIPAGAVKPAKDLKGGFDGYYFKLDPVTTADLVRHSGLTGGAAIPGVTPGLLEANNQDNLACFQVDGGFVQVPWDNHLNPQAFTLEAWVFPDPGLNTKYYYCLVESTGPTGLGTRKTGWGLYLGPDPGNPGHLVWQVWMPFSNKVNQVAVGKYDFIKDASSNPVSQLSLTYLALTFDGSKNLQLFVYFPLLEMDLDLLETPYLNILIPNFTFQPNNPTPDGQGDFFIGAGSNLFPLFGAPPHRLYPFKGRIQEVALYKSDLSANAGAQTILASHFLAGGNM